jgi:hypothetical protein
MLGIVHLALTVGRRVLRIHQAAIIKPKGHLRLLFGHGLELLAVAAQARGYGLITDAAGIVGAALLVYHVLITAEA